VEKGETTGQRESAPRRDFFGKGKNKSKGRERKSEGVKRKGLKRVIIPSRAGKTFQGEKDASKVQLVRGGVKKEFKESRKYSAEQSLGTPRGKKGQLISTLGSGKRKRSQIEKSPWRERARARPRKTSLQII